MGSKNSKSLISNHQREINNSPNIFLCDNSNCECVKSVTTQSAGYKSNRNRNKFCGIPAIKDSYNDEDAEEVESGELLGEGTNKTLLPLRHQLQRVSSGEWVNGVPFIHNKERMLFR